MSEQTFRINRRGCLAVHLMPKYHGIKLENAVERIEKHGPRDKYEQGAVLAANEDDCGDDPKFPTSRCG